MNVGNLALRFFGVLIGVRGVSRTGGCPYVVCQAAAGSFVAGWGS